MPLAPEPATSRHLRVAGRALGRAGLVHAYGHCSVRVDRENLVVTDPKPLGLLGPNDNGMVVSIAGELPAGVLGEVRIHQAIYAQRADVHAICRIQPPHVMALSAARRTPRPLHGFGAYFAPRPPMFDDCQLVRDAARSQQVADTLGSAPAIVLRGNGAVVTADSLEKAVVLSWYLEDAARVELAIVPTSAPMSTMSDGEAEARATWAGGIVERMWDYLTDADDEREAGPSSMVGAVGPDTGKRADRD